MGEVFRPDRPPESPLKSPKFAFGGTFPAKVFVFPVSCFSHSHVKYDLIWSTKNSTSRRLFCRCKLCHTCNGANNDKSLGRVIRFLEVLKQQPRKQKVAEVVSPNTELKPFSREGRFLGSWLVDSGIAHQDIEGSTGAPEVINELADAVEGGEVQVHDGIVFLGHAGGLGSSFSLEEVPAGHDHVPFSSLGESLRCR